MRRADPVLLGGSAVVCFGIASVASPSPAIAFFVWGLLCLVGSVALGLSQTHGRKP